jgi:hypothetical protein
MTTSCGALSVFTNRCSPAGEPTFCGRPNAQVASQARARGRTALASDQCSLDSPESSRSGWESLLVGAREALRRHEQLRRSNQARENWLADLDEGLEPDWIRPAPLSPAALPQTLASRTDFLQDVPEAGRANTASVRPSTAEPVQGIEWVPIDSMPD